MTPFNYHFYINSWGGQLGYLRWVNKLDLCRVPDWVRGIIPNEFGNVWMSRPLYEEESQES